MSKKQQNSKSENKTELASAISMPDVNIGIKNSDRKSIAEGLSHYMADAFTLYLKTHTFHWNVTGPMFNSLHSMFETQYTEQWAALDEIAERIRALGYNAPGSYQRLSRTNLNQGRTRIERQHRLARNGSPIGHR